MCSGAHSKPLGAAPSPRAGCDVWYLLWLAASQLPAAEAAVGGADAGFLARVFRGGAAAAAEAAASKRDKALAKVLVRAVADQASGFSAFRNLPFDSNHPFWAAFSPAAVAGPGARGAGADVTGGATGPTLMQMPRQQALYTLLRSPAWERALLKVLA